MRKPLPSSVEAATLRVIRAGRIPQDPALARAPDEPAT
jgi:hypothetical protein